MFQAWSDTAWASAARFMARGQASRIPEIFNPLMANVTVSAGCYGMVERCAIVFIN